MSSVPKPGDAHQCAVLAADAGRHGMAAAPVWLKKRLGRNETMLRLAPGIAKAGRIGMAAVAVALLEGLVVAAHDGYFSDFDLATSTHVDTHAAVIAQGYSLNALVSGVVA